MINNKKIAKRYAKAFVNKEADRGKIEILTEEIKALVVVIKSNDSIRNFFFGSLYSREVKLKVTKNIVQRLKFSSYTYSLLELLIRKDRIDILLSVSKELEQLSDEIHNRVRVNITTAFEPSVSELDEISQGIRKYFEKEVVVKRIIDPSIIGGFIIEGDGKLIDMSVRGQIKRILSRV